MSGRGVDNHTFIATPSLWPNATLQSTADFVHALGMTLGTYSAESPITCCGHDASEGFEVVDANSFAAWGVDYLKVDGCNSNYSYYATGYPKMGAALEASGRPIAYSCSWPDYWMSEVHGNITSVNWAAVINAGCNQFRVAVDIDCNAASLFKVVDYFGDNGVDMAPIHGPGHWMDADQLIIGNQCITHDEELSQMALWSVLAQPLIASTDFRNISAASSAILLNAAAISIAQDPLGIMGLRLESSSAAPTQRWARPLLGGDKAVVLLNRHGGAAPCPAWNVTLDGFPQCCGGCCTGFSNLSVAEAEAQCCLMEECAGFSYDPVARGGCFKTAPNCGFVNSTQYQGYFRAHYPPPVPPPADIEIVFADVDLVGPVRVYDVFAQVSLGVFEGAYVARGVPFHGVAFLRLSRAGRGGGRAAGGGGGAGRRA